jgi:tetratricopeptide (TPR) repeat protein
MTLDASKDKYDSIKDTQDKLFSLIAALSALLTLLGFKGVESFFKARTVAIDAAKDAKGVVLSLEEQKQQYSEDNRVELAISTGAALRDIADMYEVIMRKTSANPVIDPTKDKEYIGYLEQAETHLRFAAYENTSSDKKITARALGTLGNVLYRLKRYTEALEVNKLILKKYNASDIDACFNMACYCSKIAEEFSLQNRHQDADKHAHQSIDHARTYISMETAPSKAKIFLDGEGDLDFIRKHMLSGYTALFS